MKIQLKNIHLSFFKGIRDLRVNFGDSTDIYGENAAGKTTVFDAFLWLLFGKDSEDRKDFEIKTLQDGQPMHKVDHEVSATLMVDGETNVLRRVYKEKWTKRRGSDKEELTGHENLFYWSDVPMQLAQYQAKVAGIVNEDLFKLLTNPAYFNSMKWQDRRRVLLEIAGDISDANIVSLLIHEHGQHFETLAQKLKEKKTLDEHKREAAAKKKKLKDELALIPARIDEVRKSMPEPKDYVVLEQDLQKYISDLKGVEDAINSKAEAVRQQQDKQREAQKQIFSLQRDIDASTHAFQSRFEQEERNATADVRQAKDDVRRLTVEIQSLIEQEKAARAKVDSLVAEKTDLLTRWSQVNESTASFEGHAFSCPTCKRALEAADVESKKAELRDAFNTDKQKTLEKIQLDGRSLKASIDAENQKLGEYATKLLSLQQQLSSAQEKADTPTADRLSVDHLVSQAVTNDDTIKEKQARIVELEKITKAPSEVDTSELTSRKAALTVSIEDLKLSLSTKMQLTKAEERIAELQRQEREFNAQLNEVEGLEFQIEQFEKAKMDELQNRIDSRFKFVRFKLFDVQVNGGEAPCCETLVNGVPYSDANNAGRINAGLDIIDTLSEHYGVTAPVFVDNAESVNDLLPVSSQVIRLVVSRDKKLRVETTGKLETALF